MERARPRQQEAEDRHQRARQRWPQRHEPSPGLPAKGIKLPQATAGIFYNRKDELEDGAEEFGHRRRPWRNNTVERHVLGKRAGHVMVPSRGENAILCRRGAALKAAGKSRSLGRARKRYYKSNVPGSC